MSNLLLSEVRLHVYTALAKAVASNPGRIRGFSCTSESRSIVLKIFGESADGTEYCRLAELSYIELQMYTALDIQLKCYFATFIGDFISYLNGKDASV